VKRLRSEVDSKLVAIASHPLYRTAVIAATMAAKYAFTSGLKEVRFHLCHSSQASDAARFVSHHPYELSLSIPF
jgi:hypothetical protein